jgi:hypothetical protein
MARRCRVRPVLLLYLKRPVHATENRTPRPGRFGYTKRQYTHTQTDGIFRFASVRGLLTVSNFPVANWFP